MKHEKCCQAERTKTRSRYRKPLKSNSEELNQSLIRNCKIVSRCGSAGKKKILLKDTELTLSENAKNCQNKESPMPY